MFKMIVDKIETCALCSAKPKCTFLCKPMEALLQAQLEQDRIHTDKTIKQREIPTDAKEIDLYHQPEIYREKPKQSNYRNWIIKDRGRQKSKYHSDDPS